MLLHWDKGIHYLLITLSRSSQWEHSKYQISFSLQYFEIAYLYSRSQAPFIDIPSTVFSNLNKTRFQRGEYNLKKKAYNHNRKIYCLCVHLYSRVLNNNKTFYACAPLFSGANHIISNNFYLYLINICIITKINVPSILIIFFRANHQCLSRAHDLPFWLILAQNRVDHIPRCLDRGHEHS